MLRFLRFLLLDFIIAAIAPGCSGTPQVTPEATGGSPNGGASNGSGGLSSSGGATSHSSNVGGTTGVATQAASGGSSIQGCPDGTAYVGNTSWPQQVEVKTGAVYCGNWREGRTLEQELAAKAKLQIAAGTYPLPDTAGTYAFALPVCIEFPNGTQAPTFAGAGQIRVSKSTYASDVYFTDRSSQPLSSSGSGTWSFECNLSLTSTIGTQPAPLVFDGTGMLSQDGSSYQLLSLCPSSSCTGATTGVGFESCDPTTYALNRTTVTFAGGQAVFDVRLASLPGGISESPVFVVASGMLDSIAFEQRDYWKLVYAATHHQFSRSFAVLFDAPINGACGIKVTSVDPYSGSQLPEVSTIQCDLSNVAVRTVSTVVTERL
jgi:hypothetical protein